SRPRRQVPAQTVEITLKVCNGVEDGRVRQEMQSLEEFRIPAIAVIHFAYEGGFKYDTQALTSGNEALQLGDLGGGSPELGMGGLLAVPVADMHEQQAGGSANAQVGDGIDQARVRSRFGASVPVWAQAPAGMKAPVGLIADAGRSVNARQRIPGQRL